MATITLKEREIPLIYTVYEMKTIQEEIAPLHKAINMIMGNNPENSEDKEYAGSAEHIGAIAKMVKILGNAGLEEAGEKADLTEKAVMRAMKPTDFAKAVNACIHAMNEGMASEVPQEKKNAGPVDVTLEEIEKKKEKEN